MTTLAPACAPSAPDPGSSGSSGSSGSTSLRPGEPGYLDARFRLACERRQALAGPMGRHLAYRMPGRGRAVDLARPDLLIGVTEDSPARPAASTADGLCAHPGAGGPCMPRVRDGRCVWCERQLPPASRREDATRLGVVGAPAPARCICGRRATRGRRCSSCATFDDVRDAAGEIGANAQYFAPYYVAHDRLLRRAEKALAAGDRKLADRCDERAKKVIALMVEQIQHVTWKR